MQRLATQRRRGSSATSAKTCDQRQPDSDHHRHHTASKQLLRWLVGCAEIRAGLFGSALGSSLAKQICEEGLLSLRIALQQRIAPQGLTETHLLDAREMLLIIRMLMRMALISAAY